MALPPVATTDGELILIAGALLSVAIGSALLADRIRIPGLLFFIGLGMLVGEEGLGGVAFDDVELTRTVGVIGLSLILFEGGLSAGWAEIRPVLGPATALAVVGTTVTAVLTGLAAMWILDLGTLEGLIVGGCVAATDSAAIFAVLRGSKLRRRLARTLEGESGLNDPFGVLLVIGFIDWLQDPGYGALDMAGSLALQIAVGVVVGFAVGRVAQSAFRALREPTPGLYPVASIASVALAYGVADTLGGSGFLAVYLTGLALGRAEIPGRRTILPFHVGVAWVAQISFFFVLGLLVFPSRLLDVAGDGLLLSAVLMFVARPVAAFASTIGASFRIRERAMLGWAGLRGAVPIWLATLPVIEHVPGSDELFSVIFFVVVTSTLIQGATFEPLARRLGLTTSEAAVPAPLHESGRIARLGGTILSFKVPAKSWIAGLMIKEIGLPRAALVNVIVRGAEVIPPRGSTVIEAGDELHVLVRSEAHESVEELTRSWRSEQHPDPVAVPQPLPHRAAQHIFTVGPWRPAWGDPARPESVAGVAVLRHLRTRRDEPGALVALVDGRFAATSSTVAAVGGKVLLSRWCSDRATRAGPDAEQRAWWQEVVGALHAPSG